MERRDELQTLWADIWLNSSQRSMLNLCPRSGKIKTAINIMKRMEAKDVLISIPRNDLISSWEEDFNKWGFRANTRFTTHMSAVKQQEFKGDLFIIDEPQEASIAQLKGMSKIVKNNKSLLLSGTVTRKTENRLWIELGTDICWKYSIEEGIADEILSDYQITIHRVDLDDKIKWIEAKNGSFRTEKDHFKKILWVRNKLEDEEKPYFFMDLKLINILQNSIAKRDYTKMLLNQSKDQRILVFCGLTEIADSLKIPVYHSKSKEKEVFSNFCNGIGNHLATIKLMQSGVTIKPISKGIINYTSGNPEDTAQKLCRFLTIEYDNPEKRAEIHIISSNELFELERLNTGLSFFNSEKIKYYGK